MINKESIISLFDDKPTLLAWLKKVEEALKGASATSFKVNKKGNATLTFSIIFDDGSEIESDPFMLEQGESVQSSYIQNGNLHLVLTNGDDLDAGNMFDGDVDIGGSLSATSVKTPSLNSDADEIEAQKAIVEVMTGYTFGSVAVNGLTYEHIYAGVVKNGNKLTIVHALKINRTEAQSGISKNISYFGVPTSIAGKLFSTNIAGYDVLSFMQANAIKTDTSFIPVKIYIDKYGQRLNINLQGSTIDDLPLNSPVYLRIEATFLLSSNLAA